MYVLKSKLKNGEIRQHLKLLYPKHNLDVVYADEYKILNTDKSFPFKFLYLWLPDFDNDISEEIYNKVVSWLNNLADFKLESWLYFCGPVGVCKTSLVTTMLKYSFCILRNRTIRNKWKSEHLKFNEHNLVRFWNSHDIINDAINRKEIFEQCKNTFVLAIDDLTKPTGEYYPELLDNILRYRELNCLPTLITSQVSMEGIKELLPLPLFDIIKGTSEEVIIAGESKRGI